MKNENYRKLELENLSQSLVSESTITIGDLGQKIRSLRKALGMTQKQLAKKIQTKQPLIARIEKDASSCSLKTLSAIIHALGFEFKTSITSERNIQNIINNRAKLKAQQLVNRTSANMALEKQQINESDVEQRISELAKEMANNPKPELWED